MRIFKESKQKHLYFSAAFALSLALAPTGVYAGTNTSTAVQAVQQNGNHKVTGRVVDSTGEPLIGATILVEGTTNGTVTDIDGNYTLNTTANAKLVFSYIGYAAQTIPVGGKGTIDVTLKEEANTMNEVVVTAMGIQRKEESLTYATQRVKAEDLMKVQDPNVANSLEGKVSGLTITPSAGGAGGSTKIVLRGAKSILGNSSPLIVVDGVPMTNDARGNHDMNSQSKDITYAGMSEGSDPLSLINPDDIESINVLKGANAAALYGSVAANGVVMITTKRGREGKLDINVTSNITFDTPLLTPKIQNTYGATINGNTVQADGWGAKIGSLTDNQLTMSSPLDSKNFGAGAMHNIYLRNYTEDEVKDFLRTGVTTNNSVSLSGGTEKMTTYFSMANSHAKGLFRNNNYNRNTFSLRQNYRFFNRLKVDLSLNYAQTITRNRPGGGTVGNPLYHLYLTPRNVSLGYYRDNYVTDNATWMSREGREYYELGSGGYNLVKGSTQLTGPRQNWVFMNSANNNPYWLINMNNNKQTEDRIWGTLSANVDIYDGLTFQARVNYDHTRYTSTSRRYATTFLPAGMDDYGHFWDTSSKTTELYIDYLLSYNKKFGDYDVSGSAGWVGHTIRGEYKGTDVEATYIDRNLQKLPSRVNYFDTSAGGMGGTSSSKSSNWDRAWLATAQLGWKETVYFDASYRRDWYRPFRYFKELGKIDTDNYGYFGVGANAIVSQLVKLPDWFNFLKYRVSYSSVGNSIPNKAYGAMSRNLQTGALSGNKLLDFSPVPEETGSFETGIESLFLNNRLSFDFTFYNTIVRHLYMELGSLGGNTELLNSAKVRNTGFETTVGYDFKFGKDLRWRTSYNLSYNDNKILETGYDKDGTSRKYQQTVGEAKVIYQKGGAIGDIYAGDFMRDANGHIVLTAKGEPTFDKTGSNDRFLGNMNSKWQMGWTNTFNYKEFQLSFLINGRIGGKVLSLTESYLDYIGASERTEAARLSAERNNIVATNYGNVPGMELNDGSGRIVPIQSYYQALGASSNPSTYLYNGTNFRLRELSLGYTFRDLFGQNRNLTLSFIARNLFFIYKDAPTDPDVSLSTQNGLGAFESFNMPSSRSFGFSLKANF